MKNSKLVVFGILFLGFLFLTAGWWYFAGQNQHLAGMEHQVEMKGAGDVVTCPVMGTKMEKDQAYSKTYYDGKPYYFCCGGCPGEFEKNPEKYVK